MLRPLDSDDAVRTREALQELVQTDGWTIFRQHVLHEFNGPGFVSRIGLALGKQDPQAAQVVYQTAQEILRQLQWPYDQIRSLEAVE